MTDSSPYRQLCSLLEQNLVFQENNKRRAWVAAAELMTLESRLLFDESAIVFVPSLLRAIVEVGGADALRRLITFLRDDSDYGYSGHPSTVAWLTTLLREPDLFTGLKAAIIAPSSTDILAAAITHFDTLPTDTIPAIHPLPMPHKMPLPPNPDFVGREEELKAMAKAVKTGQVTAVVAAGIGGVGKTQLAVEWVHRYGCYFGGGVFWLDFSDPKGLPLEITIAGEGYNLEDYTLMEVSDKMQTVKAKWADPMPTLLIFDNCEEPTLAREYLPTTGGARVLMTSRDQTWQNTLRGTHQILIETPPRARSIEFLHRFRPDLSLEDADAIAEELGDLPLALHIAGSFLLRYEQAYKEVQGYLIELRTPDLLAKLGKQAQRLKGELPTRHERDVARTFRISLERMADDPHAAWIQEVLRLMAHFSHGTPVPKRWLLGTMPEGMELLDGIDVLERLLEVGAVDVPQANMLRMHRLVAQVVLADTEPGIAASAMRDSETVILDVKPSYGEANFVRQMELWLPHARMMAERALKRRDEQAALLANEVGYLIEKLKFYKQVLPFYKEALSIRREVLGIRHPDTATSVNNLAGVYEAQGRHGEALSLYEEALSIRREVLGSRHPDTAMSANNLAGVYKSQGRYGEALPLFEEALSIRREVLGNRHPDTVASVSNLAGWYKSQGRYIKALPLYQEALSIRREVLGNHHPDTATNLSELAGVYRADGRYIKALPLYQEALSIRREVLGKRHPDTVSSVKNLALLYRIQKQYGDALAINREILGNRHPDTALALSNLAALYESQRNYAEALPLYEEAVSILVERLGVNHPNTKTVTANRDNLLALIEQTSKK